MNLAPNTIELAPEAASSPLNELEACIEGLMNLQDVPVETCLELKGKLASQTFNLVAAGQFKRGKSSIINALIGTRLLPVGVVPLTSVVTILCYGATLSIRATLHNGAYRDITSENLADYVTEKGNPNNTKGIREVLVCYPSEWLKPGIRIIDTPGIGSVYQHNTDLAYRFLPKADAVLMLLSVDQPVSQAEYDFLKQVSEYAGKIFFLLNKADLLAPGDLNESIAFVKKVLTDAMGGAVNLFPVSARLALEGQCEGNEKMIRDSLFPTFSRALGAFLMDEKGKLIMESIIRNLLRMISQLRLTHELELKSLVSPLHELRKKIDLLENKKLEILNAKDECDILFSSEVKKLLKHTIEEDLNAFKAGLSEQVASSIEQHFARNRELPLRQLYETLEQHATTCIKNAYDQWRAGEDEKVAVAFDGLCARFTRKINDMVDELFRYASELFAIAYDSTPADSIPGVEKDFYYKFWSEPTSLQILASSLVFALPKAIADRLILRKAQEYARDSIDMQSGRIRYDFAERLDKSALNFKNKILNRLEATIEGIEVAVSKGANMAQTGEAKSTERRMTLLADAQTLDNTVDRLLATLGNISPPGQA